MLKVLLEENETGGASWILLNTTILSLLAHVGFVFKTWTDGLQKIEDWKEQIAWLHVGHKKLGTTNSD
jgi:hypothetical protein